jgi:hypothetical protein
MADAQAAMAAEQGSRPGHECQNHPTGASPANVLLHSRSNVIYATFGIRGRRSCVGSDEPS